MKVVITGGAGFIGSRLARALLERGTLTDRHGNPADISELVIFDRVAPEHLPGDPRLKAEVGQANNRAHFEKVLDDADSVFHFASVVSGGAEADLRLGLSVNLDGTRMLLDILAAGGKKPKLIFSSSFAVYGGATDIDDTTATFPQSSYGVQKLCCELLIGDYSRRGLIDGRAMRFPTIAVRPGKANKANSSFISNVIREPLAGRETVCPVPEDMAIALMSPGRLVEAIVRVHDLDARTFGWPRALLLPAVTVTVRQMLDALEQEAGREVRERVSFAPDETVIPMVSSWPVNVSAQRAGSLEISADAGAPEIVRDYMRENSFRGLPIS